MQQYGAHVPACVSRIVAALCLLRLHAGWVLFAFCTFWCCALLMPINGTAGFLVSVMTQQQQLQQLQSAAATKSAEAIPATWRNISSMFRCRANHPCSGAGRIIHVPACLPPTLTFAFLLSSSH
jgi:predicted Abi (CAAX) family protease